jgi:hypothetical protein
MTTPPRSTTPREPGADKSQQTKGEAAHPSAQGPSAGPDYPGYPYGPGPQAGYGGWPYGRPPFGMGYGPPPFGMPYGQPPYGAPYGYGQPPSDTPSGQQQQGGPYGPPPFMPFMPQQCFMPPGMLPFGPGPWQWFWSWLMPWWWSWLMSWWVFPGGVGQLPPFPNPAQYDMTMQFAATRAEFWRNSFEAAGRVAQQAANASRFPGWGPMPPMPPMPDGAAQRPSAAKVNMQELDAALKSMSDPAQAHTVKYAVILLQQADQMYRRGRPQAGGEDWR